MMKCVEKGCTRTALSGKNWKGNLCSIHAAKVEAHDRHVEMNRLYDCDPYSVGLTESDMWE